jgi:adenosylhomocysteine nucleosidase
MNPPRILVCVAVPEEAAFLPRAAPSTRVLVTGMGPRQARQSLLQALSSSVPDLVLSCGFAGGLNPKLPASSVLFHASPRLPDAWRDALARAGAAPARFHTTHHVLTTAEEKSVLWQTTGADAVEMESGPLMELCDQRDIPGAILRVISDTARENLPLDFNRLMTPRQNLSLPRLLGAVLASPQVIPGLVRLRRRTRHAARQLARVIAQFHRTLDFARMP